MNQKDFTKQDFTGDIDINSLCDFCDAAGQQEGAEYMTTFAVEGLGAYFFRTPRPLYLCDQCYDQLPD